MGDSGHEHDCSASSSSVSHSHDYVRAQFDFTYPHSGPIICGSENNECHKEVVDVGHAQSTESTSVSVSTSCSTSSHSSGIGGVDSAAHSGAETRPINMKVSY